MKIREYHQQHRELQVILTITVLVAMFRLCWSMMAKTGSKTKGWKVKVCSNEERLPSVSVTFAYLTKVT